jgi:hypothetical protein
MSTRILAALPVVLLLLSGSAAAEGPEFVGVKKCKSCHGKEKMGDQCSVWNASVHAEAFETLGTEKAKKWAAERGLGDPQAEEDCLRCHVTAHEVADESPAWDPGRYKLGKGGTAGFDYEQAVEEIAHPVPDDYDASGGSSD